jgi:hypothetical protein
MILPIIASSSPHCFVLRRPSCHNTRSFAPADYSDMPLIANIPVLADDTMTETPVLDLMDSLYYTTLLVLILH